MGELGLTDRCSARQQACKRTATLLQRFDNHRGLTKPRSNAKHRNRRCEEKVYDVKQRSKRKRERRARTRYCMQQCDGLRTCPP